MDLDRHPARARREAERAGGAGGAAERAPLALAEVREVALPLRRSFVTGFGVTDTRRTVLVHLVDEDGHEGWGEAPALDHPYYLPDTTSTTFEVIREYALRLALDAGVEPADVAAALAAIRGNTIARAGVEAAFWSLAAAASGRSLRELVGGTATAVPVGESIGIDTLDATLAEVELRLREGYRRIKLKIRPGWDLQVVREVRDLVGDDVMVQVDANGSYTLDQAEVFVRLDDFDLACVEQPLGWDALGEHARLQRLLRTPVCLDESLRSFDDVARALDLDACRNVNLKPARVGGLTASLRIAELCRARGVPLWCGGMLESGIGRAGNLALCSVSAFTQPADMSPASIFFRWDLVDPTYEVASDGTVTVPTGPGLGFDVRTDRVQTQTKRMAVLYEAGQDSR